LFWSNAPSLLAQKLVLEQRSITFGPKACFGAQHSITFVQKLVWEQRSIAFQTKTKMR